MHAPYRADQVGSLLRPASLADARRRCKGGELDAATLREQEDRAIDEAVRRQLDAILHHHALAVWVALDLLACEWRSEKIGRQLDALDGLGEPAAQLEELYAELAHPSTTSGRTAIRASAGMTQT